MSMFDPALVEKGGAVAVTLHVRHVVRSDHDRTSLVPKARSNSHMKARPDGSTAAVGSCEHEQLRVVQQAQREMQPLAADPRRNRHPASDMSIQAHRGGEAIDSQTLRPPRHVVERREQGQRLDAGHF